MPIRVYLTAGSKIMVMSDAGRVIKVLSQPKVKFKIVSAGPQGISAFGVWQSENPGGSLGDYFEAIKGAASTVPGPKGDDGKSAYQVAVDGGFSGNEAEWLTSLQAKFTPASATKVTTNFIYFRLAEKINRFDRSTFEKTTAVGTWADRETLGYS